METERLGSVKRRQKGHYVIDTFHYTHYPEARRIHKFLKEVSGPVADPGNNYSRRVNSKCVKL